MKTLTILSAIFLMVSTFAAWGHVPFERIKHDPRYHQAAQDIEKLSKNNNGVIDGLIRYLGNNPGLRDFALHRLVAMRCHRYLPDQDAELCEDAVWDMLETLDFDVRFGNSIPESKLPPFVFVAFQKHLIQLLNNEVTGRYLDAVAQKFEAQSYTPLASFNLWEMTLEFYQGREQDALAALAILFQDISNTPLHLEYLARRRVDGSRSFNPNVAQLARALSAMNEIAQRWPAQFKQQVYPPALNGQFNLSLYHFYVPWYLSVELGRSVRPKRFAAIAPFMLNATYEFITTRQDYGHVIWDPRKIESAGQAKDIHAGYYGALSGLPGHRRPRDVSEVTALLGQSTAQAMHTLLSDF